MSLDPKAIQENLKEHRLLYLSRYGSHLFGVATPSSDEDFKGLFLPSRNSLILQEAPHYLDFSFKQDDKGRNQVGDKDVGLYALQYFFKLLLKGDGNMVALLFSSSYPQAILYQDPLFAEVFAKADKKRLLSQKLIGMTGYIKAQAERYTLRGIRYQLLQEALDIFKSADRQMLLADFLLASDFLNEMHRRYQTLSDDENFSHYVYLKQEADFNDAQIDYLVILGKQLNTREKIQRHIHMIEGLRKFYGERSKAASQTLVDYKALYHSFRVIEEMKSLHLEGEIRYPLAARAFLLDIRQGKYSFEALSDELDKRLAELTQLAEHTVLPLEADEAYARELLLSFY
ncbi:MAG: nucleotidyltransferase domain-containing protein [Deinococcales bacterium]